MCEGAICRLQLLGYGDRATEAHGSEVVQVGQRVLTVKKATFDGVAVARDEVLRGFGSKHHIDDLASRFAVGTKGMDVAGSDENELPCFEVLADPVDPMGGATVFNQKNLKEIVVMRCIGKPGSELFAGKMKALCRLDVVFDEEGRASHAAKLVNEMDLEQQEYQLSTKLSQSAPLTSSQSLPSLPLKRGQVMLDSDLDLSFEPVRNSAPRKLNSDQIARYNEAGFVQPFDIFSTAEIDRIRSIVDRYMDDLGPNGAYGINCYQARLSSLWDIATDPRILDHVADLIGPNILCWATAILSKKPHDPKAVPWHQDASFWSLSPARTVTVWLAIDDADEANSAMRFIPGTHNKGALRMTAKRGEANVFHKGTADAETMGEPFTNCLEAGQISMHADMLVHGSLANTSDRRRCGFTLRYCPPEVEITDRQWAQGVEAILCRGDAGSWRTFPRPENDDITKTTSPHVVGNN